MIDRVNGSTIRIRFTTNSANGAPVAPSSAFAASDFRVYKDGSATQKTTTNGITVTSPFDAVVGRHLIEIDTSNATGDAGFWTAGSEYTVEINSAKTVDSVSQSGVIVGDFRLVAAEANTIAPATPTNVSDAQTAILARLPAALVGGRMDASVGAMAANTLTAAAIAPDAGAELAALVETYIVNEGDATAVLQAIADKIAQDWIASDASPVAIATAVWSVATRTITGGVLTTSPPTAAVIADAVWDEARAGHATAGTFGEKVTAELDSASTAAIRDGIPKVGETHRYTQVDSSATTTDVSIGNVP